MLLLVETEAPAVTVYRRQPDGSFAMEYHAALDETIALPEIDAALLLADLYERVEFAP